MKINWDRWVRRDKRTLLFCGYSLVAFAFFILYLDFSKTKIKGNGDLIYVKGPFENYTWKNLTKGSVLTLRLQNFHANFQIPADFYGILNRDKLDSINTGENTIVGISKKDKHDLDSNDRVVVFSVTTDHFNILNISDSIKKYNDYTFEYGSAISGILGIIFLYFGYKNPSKKL